MNEAQLKDTIQRWRDTPEGSLKPEDHKLFKNVGSSCISQGQSAQLLSFIQDEKNQGIVRSMGCGLVPLLVNEVVKKQNSSSVGQAAITHLAQTCCPKEILLAFLNQVEDIHPDVISDTVTALAQPLQTVLLRLGDDEDRASSVGLALSALQKQVSRLPVPYTQQQELDDQHGLCRCCTAMARFVEPFVDEVKRKDNAAEEMKTEILKFCLRSLREPLLQAQLDRTSQSPIWSFATQIMATLTAIQESIPDLLFYGPARAGLLGDKTKTQEAYACLAYLLHVQLIAIDHLPAVFSPIFVLQCNMEYINLLLSRKEESWLLKGLALYDKSLEQVEDRSLPVQLLELETFYSVPQKLLKILTDCPIQHLREKGLKVFQLFIDKLDAEAKHKFFRCMLKTSHHGGVEGYVIKNIRSQVEYCIKRGVWTQMCQIKDDFLKTLRVSLNLSRAYYGAEVKKMRDDQKIKAKEARAARSSGIVQRLTVKHETVGQPPEVQYQILQSALVTFDLMESLIVRIEEITKEKEESTL
ncbi:glomulin-like [Aplochiton taeniatus]